MHGIRYLSVEIGPDCNLKHPWCPRQHIVRQGEMLSVERIVEVIQEALALGFSGEVAFHYYNEPCLYPERMAAVMGAVDADYCLWTNNTLPIPEGFSTVIRTAYEGEGEHPFAPDTRLRNYDTVLRSSVRCSRPTAEFPITYDGEVRLCCQDWKGTAVIGNVKDEALGVLYERWRAAYPSPVCMSCTGGQP